MLIPKILNQVNKKVLFVAIDAGSALFLSPIINKMTPYNDIYVIAGINSYKTFDYRGVKSKIFDEKNKISEFTSFLLKKNFDIIFLGTNLGLSLEKEIIKQAKILKSFTIAVIDHFWHTWQRFSKVKEYLKIEEAFIPDLIWVFSDTQYKQLIDVGVNKKNVEIYEHPHLSKLLSKKFSKYNSNFKFDLGIPSKGKIITYASEPLPIGKSFFYNEEPKKETIKKNLELLFKTFINFYKQNEDLFLIIKIHPTENSDYVESIINIDVPNIKIIKNIDPIKLILGSDLIMGLTSMFLLEAQALDKKVLCLDSDNSFYGKVMLNNGINLLTDVKDMEELFKSL